MADEVVLNKAAVIERCLQRIREEYGGYEDELGSNYTRQDAIVLNLLWASEAAIDLAMHLARVERAGTATGEPRGVRSPGAGRKVKSLVGEQVKLSLTGTLEFLSKHKLGISGVCYRAAYG